MAEAKGKAKVRLGKSSIIAIVVIALLGVILLIQYITMGVLSAREAELKAELARVKALEEKYGMTQEELDAYLLRKALEEGYGNPSSPYLTEE